MGPSPLWLRARLIAAGQRPISNIVDVTNYVMLLTGQPLHSYDLDQVAGGILVVRAADDGEKITTLDGNERVLDSEMVLICDEDGPSGGVAGVMGGRDSEVSDSTTRVLLEAATWNGPNILRTSNELGPALRSVGSLREAASSRAGDARAARRVEAHLRELGRNARARHDRRGHRAARTSRDRASLGADRGDPGHPDRHRRGSGEPDPAGLCGRA